MLIKSENENLKWESFIKVLKEMKKHGAYIVRFSYSRMRKKGNVWYLLDSDLDKKYGALKFK